MKYRSAIALIGLILFACSQAAPAYAETGGNKPTTKEASENKESGAKNTNGSTSNGEGEEKSKSPSTTTTAPPNPPANPPTSTSANSKDLQMMLHTTITKSPVLSVDAAKQAVTDGKAASMTLLITFLTNNQQGQILDVKLHDTPQGLAYEIKALTNAVVLRTLYLDAATLKPL